MGELLFLRKDFETAGRLRFIDTCLDLMDKAADIYARQPGLSERDVNLLVFDMSPSEKYDSFAQRVPVEHAALVDRYREQMRLLLAGVVVHERLRQTREWLGYYEGFAAPIRAADMDEFPRLNVRREMMPEIYDTITAQSFPTHVQYALKTSDRAFVMAKQMDRVLRCPRITGSTTPTPSC